jgi:hypothetical protein
VTTVSPCKESAAETPCLEFTYIGIAPQATLSWPHGHDGSLDSARQPGPNGRRRLGILNRTTRIPGAVKRWDKGFTLASAIERAKAEPCPSGHSAVPSRGKPTSAAVINKKVGIIQLRRLSFKGFGR